jgi:hypothetical protein
LENRLTNFFKTKKEDYIVYGPDIYDIRETLTPHPIRVFIKAGKGNINLGDNPCYTEEDKDQEYNVRD